MKEILLTIDAPEEKEFSFSDKKTDEDIREIICDWIQNNIDIYIQTFANDCFCDSPKTYLRIKIE